VIQHLQQHPVGLIHLVLALVALVAGALVIANPKGTRRHRRIGRVYLVSMTAMNGFALLNYELYGHFGPFHWMALISLATLAGGYLEARRRSPGWMTRHAYYMAGSYVGLLAATVAEVASRVPGWHFGIAVVTSSLLVIVAGIWIMIRTIPRSNR